MLRDITNTHAPQAVPAPVRGVNESDNSYHGRCVRWGTDISGAVDDEVAFTHAYQPLAKMLVGPSGQTASKDDMKAIKDDMKAIKDSLDKLATKEDIKALKATLDIREANDDARRCNSSSISVYGQLVAITATKGANQGHAPSFMPARAHTSAPAPRPTRSRQQQQPVSGSSGSGGAQASSSAGQGGATPPIFPADQERLQELTEPELDSLASFYEVDFWSGPAFPLACRRDLFMRWISS